MCLLVSLPFRLPALLKPIHPATRILSDSSPPGIPRDPGGAPAPHAGLAVKDDLGVLVRPREAEPVLEFLGADVEAVGGGGDGNVDRVGDVACLLQLAGLADVWGLRRA